MIDFETASGFEERNQVEQAVVISTSADRDRCGPEALYEGSREVRGGRQAGDGGHGEQPARGVGRQGLAGETELIGNGGRMRLQEAEDAIALLHLPRVGAEPRVIERDIAQRAPGIETEIAAL